ncbi:hypothetical protein D6C93_10060 [Aureobasidium pullulans]|nr:hypothetical protein D6C93_10060 [Aureobasidium pullulans]
MYRLLFVVLLFVLQLVAAVTLNDFTPRLDDLAGDCKAVYTTQITGCAGTDFQSGVCSSSCISALQSIGASVRKSCQSQSSNDNNIIAAFLTGTATGKLCPNANKAVSSSTSSFNIGSSTMVLSDTTVSATGIIVDTSSASPSVVTALWTATINPIAASSSSSTESATPAFTGITSTITGSSLAFATNTPSSVLMATATTLSSTHSAKHTQSSDSNSGGGGGTPFDTSAAAYGSSVSYTLLSGTVALLFLLC